MMMTDNSLLWPENVELQLNVDEHLQDSQYNPTQDRSWDDSVWADQQTHNSAIHRAIQFLQEIQETNLIHLVSFL